MTFTPVSSIIDEPVEIQEPVTIDGTVSVNEPVTVDGTVTALDEDATAGASANVTGTGSTITVVASNAARKAADDLQRLRSDRVRENRCPRQARARSR